MNNQNSKKWGYFLHKAINKCRIEPTLARPELCSDGIPLTIEPPLVCLKQATCAFEIEYWFGFVLFSLPNTITVHMPHPQSLAHMPFCPCYNTHCGAVVAPARLVKVMPHTLQNYLKWLASPVPEALMCFVARDRIFRQFLHQCPVEQILC